jgi:TPR repeat protein
MRYVQIVALLIAMLFFSACFQKSAGTNLNNADAQFNTGIAFMRKGDYAKAVEWCRKAADQGHAVAQNNLGVFYAAGNGVPKDEAKAMEWLFKAVEQGHKPAIKVFEDLGWEFKILDAASN